MRFVDISETNQIKLISRINIKIMSGTFILLTFILLLSSSICISLGLIYSQNIICDIPIKVGTHLIHVYNYLLVYGIYWCTLYLYVCMRYCFRDLNLKIANILAFPYIVFNMFYVILGTIILMENKDCIVYGHVAALFMIWMCNIFAYIIAAIFIAWWLVTKEEIVYEL